MENQHNILFDSLLKAFACDTGLIDPVTKKGMITLARTLFINIDTNLIVKSAFRTGLSSSAAALIINSGIPTLMQDLLDRMVQDNLEIDNNRGLQFSPLKFPKDQQEQGWELWTKLAPKTTVENRCLAHLIEAGQAKDYTLLDILTTWYLNQSFSLHSDTWVDSLNTIRILDQRARGQIITALTHSFKHAQNTKAIHADCLRKNSPYGSIIALRETRDGHTFLDCLKTYTTRHSIRHPIFEWLATSGVSGHGFLRLQHGDLSLLTLLSAEKGNPDTLISNALGLPTLKDWQKSNKQERQRERGRTPGDGTKRKVKPRRLQDAKNP